MATFYFNDNLAVGGAADGSGATPTEIPWLSWGGDGSTINLNLEEVTKP